MRTDTFSPETRRKYEGTNLWRPWMSEYRLWQITSLDELSDFLEQNHGSKRIGWDVETKSLDAHPNNVCGHCLSFDGKEGVYIPTQHVRNPSQNLDHEAVWDLILEFMKERVIYVYNWMFEGRILRLKGHARECSLNNVNDVMIYRWLYDSDKRQFNLKDAAAELLKVPMLTIHEVPGIKTGKSSKDLDFSLSDPEDATLYAAADPVFTLAISDKIKVKVDTEQPFPIQLEHALLDELLEMESHAVTIDRGYLRQARKELTHWIGVVSQKIFSIAGKEFAIDSPAQTGKVLAELGVPLGKSAKGNLKTGADAIDQFAGQYPIVDHILLYRSLVKERSTYVDALLNNTTEERPKAVFKFRSVGAPTGRFASGGVDEGDPIYVPMNVQSIPSSSGYREAACRMLRARPVGLVQV